MCTFVTLIAESDDVERLNAMLAGFNAVGYRREAQRVERPQSQRTPLAPAEQEYWLVRSPCDCGVFLGHGLSRERTDARKPSEDASFWIGLLSAIADGLALKRVSLMHADDSKSPRTEFKGAARRDSGSLSTAASALENMDGKVIYDFKPGA